MHQAEVALLDQVEQRQARRLVLLRDRHDEAQVRLHERALGVLTVARDASQLALLRGGETLGRTAELLARSVAILDLLREADFVVLGEQWVLPDVGQIEPDEIFLVALDTLLRQVLFLRSQGPMVGFEASATPCSNDPAPLPLGAGPVYQYDTDLVKRPFPRKNGPLTFALRSPFASRSEPIREDH